MPIEECAKSSEVVNCLARLAEQKGRNAALVASGKLLAKYPDADNLSGLICAILDLDPPVLRINCHDPSQLLESLKAAYFMARGMNAQIDSEKLTKEPFHGFDLDCR